MIPPFNEHGWLPDGIHDRTLDEAAARFGKLQVDIDSYINRLEAADTTA